MSSLPIEDELDSLDVLGRFASRFNAVSELMDARFKPALERAPPGVGCGIPTPATLAALKWHVWKAWRGF